MQLAPETLIQIFGAESRGTTPEERARTSKARFVRSQVQLAAKSDAAKGLELTAWQALEAFGLPVLLKVAEDGAAPLVWRSGEPANTIKGRRTQMGLTADRLAREIGVTPDLVKAAETPGRVIPIRELQRLCQALALDETIIGFAPAAGADDALGVRLRELTRARDETRFSEGVVLKLAEAAWVIRRQAQLALSLEMPSYSRLAQADLNFSYPAWQHGFRLARRTRELLSIDLTAPIPSLRALIEEQLHIPLVQQRLGGRFAGATLANDDVRGIVVNEEGMNENVWVRRMTMCHELGHLLWDPDQQLNRLNVDRYDELQRSYVEDRRDPVEVRANAFAVAFLGPPEGVRAVFEQKKSDAAGLAAVMDAFGLSTTAAKHHVQNIIGRPLEVRTGDLPAPSDEWIAAENMAVDYFPIASTPISRRGRFACMVATGYAKGRLSADSAATMLLTSAEEVAARHGEILSAYQ